MPNLFNDSNIHYVKFMRGSLAAWEVLNNTPEKISDDTLYFIYQNAQTSKDGKLYLGQKLISGVGDGSFTGDININDIGDIDIGNEPLADKQILVYNNTTQQWENTSLSTIIDTAIGEMVGASELEAGASGLVPIPPRGSQNYFLKGDGTWSPIDIPTFNTDIFFKGSNNEVTLNGFNFAPIGSTPIKTSAGLQWSNASTSLLNCQITTLEELQQRIEESSEPINDSTIYMIDNGNDPSSNNKYDEYMIINSHIERIGTFGEVNLNNYVQVATFNTAIGNLNNSLQQLETTTNQSIAGLTSRVSYIELNYVKHSEIGDLSTLLLSSGNTTLVEEVNTMREQLLWQELNNN